MSTSAKSKLHQMTMEFPTEYWNDSCSEEELTYAISHGAVGATSNPTIVHAVLKKEMHLWRDRIHTLIRENPVWSESEITWKLFEEIAVYGAGFLSPIFEKHKGKKGRLSIQTNPTLYRNAEALTEQAIHFNNLAPNMIVKIPVTKAGVKAIEEVTYHGVSINATVSFSVPQAIAVAEAVERGLNRRVAEGKSIDEMAPVCTIMVGRTDDWMKVVASRDGIEIDPSYLDWAGIACMKKAYEIYQQRGYRARLLAAAYRHLGHWAEFIGGELVVSLPYEWQLKANASDIEVKERMNIPVESKIVDEMYKEIPDFRRAYDEDGMSIDEFDEYGATVRTLRTFITSAHDLMGEVREFMLPNPDIKKVESLEA
ncbi:MAG TPA: transaldolase family protein [Anaerolineales bacterium]|nr:transaldolase family protein [Anaerolineales bacterium]